jgi:hypothetical protein
VVARGIPGRTAECSLRHPGFAHSCILAFALRAALDCKAGLSGPGLPLTRGIEVRLACSGVGSPLLKGSRRPVHRFAGGLQSGVGKRDGSTGRGAASPLARCLRHPRTRPVSQLGRLGGLCRCGLDRRGRSSLAGKVPLVCACPRPAPQHPCVFVSKNRGLAGRSELAGRRMGAGCSVSVGFG